MLGTAARDDRAARPSRRRGGGGLGRAAAAPGAQPVARPRLPSASVRPTRACKDGRSGTRSSMVCESAAGSIGRNDHVRVVLRPRAAEALRRRAPRRRRRPDVLVVGGPHRGSSAAMQRADHRCRSWGSTLEADPVASGFVKTLARPGRQRERGLDGRQPEIAGKQIQFLREALPTAARASGCCGTIGSMRCSRSSARCTASRALGVRV